MASVSSQNLLFELLGSLAFVCYTRVLHVIGWFPFSKAIYISSRTYTWLDFSNNYRSSLLKEQEQNLFNATFRSQFCVSSSSQLWYFKCSSYNRNTKINRIDLNRNCKIEQTTKVRRFKCHGGDKEQVYLLGRRKIFNQRVRAIVVLW